jgi:glutathione S-transferase
MHMITLYGFRRLPEIVIGETRDLRAQWALEETGLPYQVRALDQPGGELKTEDYRRFSPFQQIPAIDDDGFILAESAAVLLYIAEKAGKLIPSDFQGRMRVTQWCFAAVSTVEPPIFQLAWIDFFGGRDPTGENRKWFAQWTQQVLTNLEKQLEHREYIACNDFTVADILMTLVLWEIRKTDLLGKFPNLTQYFQRCQERPAWERTRRAYEDRLHVSHGTVR